MKKGKNPNLPNWLGKFIYLFIYYSFNEKKIKRGEINEM